MRAYRNPLVVAFAVILLCSALFVKGFKSAVKKVEPKEETAVVLDEEKLEEQKNASLTTPQQEQLKQLLEQEDFLSVAVLYDSLKIGSMAGKYYFKAAEAKPTAVVWKKAGDSYLNAARQSTDSLYVVFAVDRAKKAYFGSLKIDDSNAEVKNSLALCMAQGGTEVMQAVTLLKEVLAADSNNVQAIYTLGMLSIQSGQYDKAVERFEKLRQLEPMNSEYYYYLADIYSQLGQKDKAVKALEVCKTLTTSEEARKNIDELIKDIKNN
jgi:tetratricopeptide (TPR) repeat protein